MIIGTIIDVSNDAQGPQSGALNGTAMLMFYTEADAVTWAEIQSLNFPSGPGGYGAMALCSVVNTQTAQRRWWFNGTEYTG
jgi:hypothetical protein